jgi:hypothetical protein
MYKARDSMSASDAPQLLQQVGRQMHKQLTFTGLKLRHGQQGSNWQIKT